MGLKKDFINSGLMEDQDSAEGALRRLILLTKVLREECPWDKEQTHESLKKGLIEESYEAVDAINKKDYKNLEEELGDILLQIVFHSELGEDNNRFNLTGIINGVCLKMIRRHPHIFSDEKCSSIDKVLEKWENIKRKEGEETSISERLKRVPLAMPSLLRSYKLQAKAAEIGFDWDNVSKAFKKLEEELKELKEAAAGEDRVRKSDELGDLIFSAVNVARFLKVDPEEAVNGTSDRFINRFSIMERLAESEGKKLEEMTLREMDFLWERAKKL